jgi:hypothetical protein
MPDELTLITPVNDNFRRDVTLLDESILDPNEADALLQGEWVSMDPGNSGKAVRHATTTARGAMQVFTPKGDFSAQSIGKVAVLQLHEYEAETTIFEDNLPGGAVGEPLTVGTITLDGVGAVHTGLKVAAGGDIVYGVITKLPADNNGKLRFMKSTQGVL